MNDRQITALGMIETIGLLGSIVAADAALKAADVRLLGTDYVRGGLVMVRLEGEVAAVSAAVDAGSDAASRVGQVLSTHVIPRAMPEVFCMLAADVSQGPARRNQGGCAGCGGCEGGRRELERAQPKTSPLAPEAGKPQKHPAPEAGTDLSKMTVAKLRQLARRTEGIGLSPEDIRYANKQTLLDAFKRIK